MVLTCSKTFSVADTFPHSRTNFHDNSSHADIRRATAAGAYAFSCSLPGLQSRTVTPEHTVDRDSAFRGVPRALRRCSVEFRGSPCALRVFPWSSVHVPWVSVGFSCDSVGSVGSVCVSVGSVGSVGCSGPSVAFRGVPWGLPWHSVGLRGACWVEPQATHNRGLGGAVSLSRAHESPEQYRLCVPSWSGSPVPGAGHGLCWRGEAMGVVSSG